MATLARRAEFGRMRLVGATHRQLLGMVRAETLLAVLIAVGVGVGVTAAVVLPLRAGLPAGSGLSAPWGLLAGLLAGLVVLTLASSLLPARRVLAVPAREAAGAAE
jgi:putative ABC transport system permease protein